MFLTVSILSVERYVAICHPFLASKYHFSSKSRAIKAIIGMWLFEFLCSILFILYVVMVHHAKDPSVSICVHTKEIGVYLYGLESVLFFLFPMLLVLVMYILIVIKLRKSVKEIESNNKTSNHSKQRAPKILSKNPDWIGVF